VQNPEGAKDERETGLTSVSATDPQKAQCPEAVRIGRRAKFGRS